MAIDWVNFMNWHTMKTGRFAVAAWLLAVFGGCSSTPETTLSRVKKTVPDPAQLVAAVRASANIEGDELEVQSLRDPHVEDLRAQAIGFESRGKTRQADALLLQALALTPDDPDLVQWRAELALLRKAWLEAEQLASSSYERGPRLGGLCRRNWTTVELSRLARQDAAGAAVARQQRERCTIAPPVRM